MNRWADWWHQAESDLSHARSALDDRHFDWSAFAAHQVAEKAIKALIFASGGEPWGNAVAAIVRTLPEAADARTLEAAQRLDKHYIPTRYPNGLPGGYPAQAYTEGEAASAIDDATTILEFCRSRLPRS